MCRESMFGMKSICFIIFVSVISIAPLKASAAYVWLNNVTLTSASHYYNGSVDVWEITWEDSLSTGCSYSNNLKKAAWWNNNSASRWEIGGARLAPAMTALVGQLKVDILIDNATCNASFGALWQGVRVRR